MVLKRFGQEVDLEHPEKVIHTLVFDADGHQLSLPVPEETIKILVAELYSKKDAPKKAEAAPEPEALADAELSDATEFGSEEQKVRAEQDEGVAGCPNCGDGEYKPNEPCSKCGFWDGPEAEEEVPTL